MITRWDDLKFWDTGEWQVLQELFDRMKGTLSPRRELLFAALDATPVDKVKVLFVGQDPYPNPDLATGVAFAIPKGVKKFPPTLENVFQELRNDVHFEPSNGDLTKWCDQGVLLWNAIPSCEMWKSLSHERLLEWYYLNKEIVEELAARGCVFVLCGQRAQSLYDLIPESLLDRNRVIKVSHPSPRGVKFSKTPFIGSRVFSETNRMLCELGKDPINWRL